MKNNLRHLLLCAALAGLLPLALAAQGATPPNSDHPTPPADTSSAPTATSTASSTPPAAPAAPTSTVTPSDAAAAPAAPSAPESAPAAPATSGAESTTGEGSLRRLDAPASDAPAEPAPHQRHVIHYGSENDRVAIGRDAVLNKNESANAVVAIGGDAKSDGTVHNGVVAIAGDAHVTGSVSDAVVAVLGDAYVDGKVGQVVSVFGDIELGPNAEVSGDVVDVGGDLKRDPKSIVHGNIPHVHVGPFSGHMSGLQSYLKNCLFQARPLAIGPNLGWAWSIAIGFLLLYVVLALLFRGGVDACIQTLETRPGSSILAALLTLVLAPILFVLLLVTIVGGPVFAVVMVCASLFGRAVMLAWLGRRVTRLFGNGPMSHPAVGVLIGGVIVLALYLVPVAGFVVYKLIGFLGLGVVVYTLLQRNKREKAAASAASATVPMSAAGFAAAGASASAVEASGIAAETAGIPSAAATTASAVPPPVALTTLPRAGFWIRMGALLIDIVLVAIVSNIVCSFLPHFLRPHVPGFLLVIAAYGAILWKLKGTTIGGIICGLRVVRVDGRELDWATALVRALSCFISLFVAGLGFIWIAIDDEKLSWHDKIAGTTVVLVRGGQPLV